MKLTKARLAKLHREAERRTQTAEKALADGLSDAQWRALLHLYVGPQYNKRTGKRWYPSRGTYVALQRKCLVVMYGHGKNGGWVVTAEGAAAARGCIPL